MPTNVHSYKIANPATTRHEYSTRHSPATPSSPKRRLPRNDDGKGRTTLKERQHAGRVDQPPQRRGKLPSIESTAPQKQSGTSPTTRRRLQDDRGVHTEDARRRQARNNDGKKRAAQKAGPTSKNNGGRAVANRGELHTTKTRNTANDEATITRRRTRRSQRGFTTSTV